MVSDSKAFGKKREKRNRGLCWHWHKQALKICVVHLSALNLIGMGIPMGTMGNVRHRTCPMWLQLAPNCELGERFSCFD
jgi:hypothetical protein